MSAREGVLVALLLLMFALLAIGSLQRMTLTYDETDHYHYGWKLLHFDASRGEDNSKMPFSMLNTLPRKVASLLDDGPVRRRLETIEFGRHVTVACALMLAWLVYRWARALYGPAAGLFSLVLFVFDPNVLAHAELVTTDLYAAWMTALAVWSFWRLLNHEGPGVWRVATVSAVLVALAQVAKYTCAYLVPILALTALGHAVPTLWALAGEGRWRAAGARCLAAARFALLYVAAFLVVVNAAYWGLRTLRPLRDYEFASHQFRGVQEWAGPVAGARVPLPEPYLQGLDRVLADERGGANVYLLGQSGQDGVPGQRFPEYFLVAWLYKEPIATQVLLLLALAAYALRWRRFDFRRNEWPLACAVAFFAWYFIFVYNFQVGFRHALVVHPLLFVLAGSLLRAPRELSRGARVALAGLLVWLGVSTLSYYPHFLAYFNEFVRDRTQSYRILVDSNLDWGQSGRYVERYLRAHPDASLEPERPRPGTLLVSANKFSGLLLGEQFRWLRENFEPVGHVAYAYLLFHVTPEALRRVIDPVPPDAGDKVN
ncbi:MAG TPA: glycosyltransferase family 39 protein [Methylomirabilota bacterium]|jgi:hypothetical protein